MYLGDVKRKQRAKRNLLWRAMLHSKAIINIRNKSSGLRVDVKKKFSPSSVPSHAAGFGQFE